MITKESESWYFGYYDFWGSMALTQKSMLPQSLFTFSSHSLITIYQPKFLRLFLVLLGFILVGLLVGLK
jgi:hypothetical protein